MDICQRELNHVKIIKYRIEKPKTIKKTTKLPRYVSISLKNQPLVEPRKKL